MSGRVAGKVALVTGAGTGIGQAAAIRLAEEGADVDRDVADDGQRGRDCRLAAEASGREAVGLDARYHRRRRRRSRRCRGRRAVRADDIVSNNAGIELVHGPSVVETTDEEWERLFRVNVTGTFHVCRAAAPHMSAGGSIVDMASIGSFIAWENGAAYTATKGALLQFTRSLALELAPRAIRANAVCPGVIDTPLTDLFLEAADDPAFPAP